MIRGPLHKQFGSYHVEKILLQSGSHLNQ
eukprot:SAG31_NODE_34979_length_327_cov_0.912281_1_plen_28_part_10